MGRREKQQEPIKEESDGADESDASSKPAKKVKKGGAKDGKDGKDGGKDGKPLGKQMVTAARIEEFGSGKQPGAKRERELQPSDEAKGGGGGGGSAASRSGRGSSRRATRTMRRRRRKPRRRRRPRAIIMLKAEPVALPAPFGGGARRGRAHGGRRADCGGPAPAPVVLAAAPVAANPRSPSGLAPTAAAPVFLPPARARPAARRRIPILGEASAAPAAAPVQRFPPVIYSRRRGDRWGAGGAGARADPSRARLGGRAGGGPEAEEDDEEMGERAEGRRRGSA